MASRTGTGTPGADGKLLRRYYDAILQRAGHRGWWPGRTRLEIVLGAILTQNTSWQNVEGALASLRAAGGLTLPGLRRLREEDLAEAIRSSGYFRQKARKIGEFLRLLDESYAGSFQRMSRAPTTQLRDDLLSVWGIGPETADSILLYAFQRPLFVVDAYTLRVAARHRLLPFGTPYPQVQRFFMDRLPVDPDLFNDFHAQLVWVGHHHCGTEPRCEGCPLERFLPPAGPERPRKAAAREKHGVSVRGRSRHPTPKG